MDCCLDLHRAARAEANRPSIDVRSLLGRVSRLVTERLPGIGRLPAKNPTATPRVWRAETHTHAGPARTNLHTGERRVTGRSRSTDDSGKRRVNRAIGETPQRSPKRTTGPIPIETAVVKIPKDRPSIMANSKLSVPATSASSHDADDHHQHSDPHGLTLRKTCKRFTIRIRDDHFEPLRAGGRRPRDQRFVGASTIWFGTRDQRIRASDFGFLTTLGKPPNPNGPIGNEGRSPFTSSVTIRPTSGPSSVSPVIATKNPGARGTHQ